MCLKILNEVPILVYTYTVIIYIRYRKIDQPINFGLKTYNFRYVMTKAIVVVVIRSAFKMKLYLRESPTLLFNWFSLECYLVSNNLKTIISIIGVGIIYAINITYLNEIHDLVVKAFKTIFAI